MSRALYHAIFLGNPLHFSDRKIENDDMKIGQTGWYSKLSWDISHVYLPARVNKDLWNSQYYFFFNHLKAENSDMVSNTFETDYYTNSFNVLAAICSLISCLVGKHSLISVVASQIHLHLRPIKAIIFTFLPQTNITSSMFYGNS